MLICEKENKIDEFISRLDELEKALGVENSEKEQLIITHEDIKKELEGDIEELKVKEFEVKKGKKVPNQMAKLFKTGHRLMSENDGKMYFVIIKSKFVYILIILNINFQ